MSQTTRAHARRTVSVVAALGVVLAMLLVGSPAQAAPTLTFSADPTTITLGESVTLTWNTEGATEVTASGDWDGTKAAAGTEDVTPDGAGTFTYTLVASDEEGAETEESVEVTVEDGPITPNPVTFPDPCTVVIPTTPNVTYYVDYGDDDIEELTADTYDATSFPVGDEITFFAEADRGFDLADDAVTEWDYTAPESCFGPDMVTTTVSCGTVTFTNTTDGSVVVLYGGEDEQQEDGEITLAAGASKSVPTERARLLFVAFADDEAGQPQFDILDVPQDCGDGDGDGNGNGSDHPTVAPAAGVAAR